MKVEFTKTQLGNLKALLARVNLTGQEVPVYLDVTKVIDEALTEKDQKSGKISE